MHTTCRFLLLLPSLLSLVACGDDSSTAGSGGGGGDAIASSSTGSPAAGSASSTNAQASTSTGQGTGGDPTGGGGDPTGSGGDDPGGGPVCDFDAPSSERVAVCEEYGAVVCDYYADCQPSLLQLLGGNLDACARLNVPPCAEQQNVDETSMLECIGALADLYDGLECGVTAVALPPACDSVGRLADAQPCNSALECAGGVCAGDGPDDCNLCDRLVGAGDACDTDAYCPSSLSCAEGECLAPAADGAPCDSARDCEGGACAQGQCATAIVADEGEACGGLALCNPSASLICDAVTQTCLANVPPEPGLLGEACVPYGVDLGGFVFPAQLCEVGSTCMEDVCVEAAFDGDACDGEVACVGSTCESGVCEADDPNLCACPE